MGDTCIVTKLRTLLALAIAPALLFVATNIRAEDQVAPPAPPVREKLKTLPPGNHKLLETMTKNFGLTMDQELEIEPLLHDEESVSKPILGFAAFTPEEQKAMLLTVKVAARRQIRPLLTAEQQTKLDEETAGLSKKSGKGGKKSSTDKSATATNAAPAQATAQAAPAKPKKVTVSTEESLTKAILEYSALTAEEKQTMIAKVKEAAHRPPTAPEQPANKAGE
jgi:hypothetical protein